MKTLLKSSLILVYFLIGFSEEEFCPNPFEPQDDHHSLFTIGDSNYLHSYFEVYKSPLNETFADKKGNYRTDLYGSITFYVQTAFFVSVIPKCNGSEVKCKQLEKLSQMGFFISSVDKRSNKWVQKYKAFRITTNGSQSPIDFITNKKDMPFGMEVENDITADHIIWPKSAEMRESSKGTGLYDLGEYYWSATYDEKNFAIVFAVGTFRTIRDIYIEIQYLEDFSHKSHPLKVAKGEFPFGFIQLFDKKRSIYLIIGNKSSPEKIVFKINSNGTKKDITKRIDFDLNTIYGCVDNRTKSPKTTKSETSTDDVFTHTTEYVTKNGISTDAYHWVLAFGIVCIVSYYAVVLCTAITLLVVLKYNVRNEAID